MFLQRVIKGVILIEFSTKSDKLSDLEENYVMVDEIQARGAMSQKDHAVCE